MRRCFSCDATLRHIQQHRTEFGPRLPVEHSWGRSSLNIAAQATKATRRVSASGQSRNQMFSSIIARMIPL